MSMKAEYAPLDKINLDDLDEETRAAVLAYVGGRKNLEPYLIEFELECFDSDAEWSLLEFRELLDQVEARLPDEFRKYIKIEFETAEYDANGGRLIIKGKRMITEKELQEKLKNVLDYVNNKRRIEKADYERLKKKYGG